MHETAYKQLSLRDHQSYDDQETYKIGNVNDEAWTDTLYAYLKQQEEKATMIKQWKKGVSWIDWER